MKGPVPRWWLNLLIVGGLGCAESGFQSNDDMDVDPSADTDSDSDSEQAPAGPHLWRLSAELSIVDGVPIIQDSAVHIEFFDSDGNEWTVDEGQSSDCDLILTDVSTVDKPPVDPAVKQWWTLALLQNDEAPCPWTLPVPEASSQTELPQIYLGLGDLDPQLLPAMSAADLNVDADLYGLYMLHPATNGDTVFIFGVAGTQGQYDGSEVTVDAPPIPNGDYALRPLFLLPVPE
ncbi:MAG: hypothetical protein ACI9MC_000603 [Kiritimatiellia bacterium]|jgi:hypothetical protein